ncbi:penicillin-binding protein 2 [Microbacterium mitrae]|uniref:Penicillin-binding protein 2 n=1 Tax=Microbacterium mitrae TaxID=664640 RepID=A0A5C8HQC8_9MICO|nr:penicillin-binding protein 2 [Microbacterium mitrae]TXK04755.1 penicillin-binding protein 2 [Microbacterium mitrae]
MTTRATRTPRRRTSVALLLIFAIIAAFTIRLIDIQVVKADEYTDAFRNARLAQGSVLYGTRGEIVDMDGAVLASTSVEYETMLDPSIVKDYEVYYGDDKEPTIVTWEMARAKIAAATDMTEAEVQTALENAPSPQWAPVKSGLTTQQYLDLRAIGVPYIASVPTEKRVYQNGAVGGNIIGFTGSDGAPLAGIELMEDACLSATNGATTYEVGGSGEIIPGSLETKPAVDGGTVQLTLDADLQWYMQQMITEEVGIQGAKYGSVLVVESKTGKIRAAAEYDTVDSNNAVGASGTSKLFNDQKEPGSTFKAVTAAMIMQERVATPMTSVWASGYETFENGAAVGDAFSHESYHYTLAGALIDSSNVAVSKFGTMLSPEKRYEWLQKFGIGETTNVNFLGESVGVLHPAENWDNQTIYASTFGQSFTVTAPQVASAYQIFANGGVKQPLQLVESCTGADGTVVKPDVPEPERILDEDVAADMSLMIENVAEQGGVADLIRVPGYRIAAKTGTAQTYDPATGGYKANVYDTSIVGFAPADDPEYVVMISLEEPTRVTSSTATAPAFQKAMTQVLKNYRVMPSESPLPELLPKFAE